LIVYGHFTKNVDKYENHCLVYYSKSHNIISLHKLNTPRVPHTGYIFNKILLRVDADDNDKEGKYFISIALGILHGMNGNIILKLKYPKFIRNI
jgi:hypothetical protein